jgi:putative hydrolase of the HAD superfamily
MIQPVQSVLRDKKYFIFDLDGTLIELRQNQLQGIWSIVKNYTPEKTINYQTLLEAFDSKVEINRATRYEIYITHGLCNNEEECESVDKFYWDGVGSIFKWMDNAEQTLIQLKKQGKKLSIVTNGEEVQHRKLRLIKETIDPNEIEFDFTEVTGDYGKEKYKPHPYCLEKVIKNYEANRDECVFIGDTLDKDCEMARNAGVDFILFDPNETSVDFDGFKIFDLTELLCTTTI